MPDWSEEDKFNTIVAGVDEAGRGPWVGPVVAGAVVFLTKNINPYLLSSLNDSKKLSAKKREKLYELILEESQKGNLCYGIGEASAEEIDEINILQATFNAMRRAVANLKVKPKVALIDGNQTPKPFECEVKTIIKGDSISLSVSAASIVAKVYRDNLMKNLALMYPQYGFEKNAGYGTKEHIEALNKYGITKEHRKSYKPVAKILETL
ncbi:MAG: ribonuclease HII [Alphaproteobacteria bacterium]|nr:ribonuclease HII [Alphaproteobacteria bacterium]